MPVKASAGDTRSWKISAPPACGGRSMATRWRHPGRRAWLDDWARTRIPAFGDTAFMPAESASVNLQRVHAEIWATARSLEESFASAKPDGFALWRPGCHGVAFHLQPHIAPSVLLAADMATVRGIPMRDLALVDGTWRLSPKPPWWTPRGAAVCGGICARARSGLWPLRHGAGGRRRHPGAAFRLADGRTRAGRRVRVRPTRRTRRSAFRPIRSPRRPKNLLSAGIRDGCDRRGGVRPAPGAAAVAACRGVWCRPDAAPLLALARWWTGPRRGTGRVCVGRATLPRAPIRCGHRDYVGSEGVGGAVVSAAKAVAVPTYLYQHGGSADIDCRSLHVYRRVLTGSSPMEPGRRLTSPR